MQTSKPPIDQDYLDPKFGLNRNGVVWVEYPDRISNDADGITLAPDRKLLIASGYGLKFSIVRLNADGTQDSSFGENGVVTGTFAEGYRSKGKGITVLESGEILLSGVFLLEDFGSPTERGLALFDTNGQPVKEFGNGGVLLLRPLPETGSTPSENQSLTETAAGATSYSVELPSGKLLVISNHRFSIADASGMMIRLNRDGTLDETFGAENKGYVFIRHPEYSTWIGSMIALESDTFAVAGSARVYGEHFGLVAVYNPDGTPSTSFGDKGFVLLNSIGAGEINGLALMGPHILAFSSTVELPNKALLVCLDKNGSFVKEFNNGEPVQTPVESAPGGLYWQSGTLRNDGKLVVIGSAVFEEDTKIIIGQYLPDGQLDTDFGNENGILAINLTGALDMGRAIAVQADNKIVVTGHSMPIEERIESFVLRCLN
jgi:uncharacterized delta-60 repeat protein